MAAAEEWSDKPTDQIGSAVSGRAPHDVDTTIAGPGNQGPATDRFNQSVIDPTKNVTELVRLAIQRQDDLRWLEAAHVREIINMRAEERKSELVHIKETMTLRAHYEDKLRDAETQRIDSIRSVDVGNVARAAEVQSAQAVTLANQVNTVAEALRVQVAAAATATAANLATALKPLQDAIAELRQVQYQQQGERATVSDTRSTHVVASSDLRGWLTIAISLGVAIVAYFAGRGGH